MITSVLQKSTSNKGATLSFHLHTVLLSISILHIEVMSLKRTIWLSPSCEAAQPEIMKTSHPIAIAEAESLHELFDHSVKSVEESKPFYKLQSPTTSEFDSDSNSEDEFCNASGSSASHFPEEDDVGSPELQNAAHFRGAAKNEPQVAQRLQDVVAFSHSEAGQPNVSREEMVTGCHSSLNVSRFCFELRNGLIQPESRFQQCMPIEVPCGDIWRLLAQQIVIVKGWKEHVSSPNKHSLEKMQPHLAIAVQLVVAFSHSEAGQPNVSRGEMVIGCHSSLNVSRFCFELRNGLIQPESRFQQCMPIEVPCGDIWRLLAQQIVIVKGWKEHISSPNKHSLKNLAYTQDLVNGHPIGKCILTAFHRKSLYYRGDFIGERKGPPLVNSSQNTTPHRKLFSLQTDASISMWEKAFSEQFGKQQILFKEHDITAPLLVVILYRCAYQGSIMINHFFERRDCMCYRLSVQLQKAMLKLDYHHSLMCKLAQQMSSKEYDEESAAKDHREQMYLLYHHCESLARNYPRIEFPHFVEVRIQRPEKKLPKFLHIIYMQIPPYFFAVPADCCEDTTFRELQPQFPSVIREIHKKLEIEKECFFRQRPNLRDKEDLVMIYPYRFDPEGQHSECRFLRVDINIDGG